MLFIVFMILMSCEKESSVLPFTDIPWVNKDNQAERLLFYQNGTYKRSDLVEKDFLFSPLIYPVEVEGTWELIEPDTIKLKSSNLTIVGADTTNKYTFDYSTGYPIGYQYGANDSVLLDIINYWTPTGERIDTSGLHRRSGIISIQPPVWIIKEVSTDSLKLFMSGSVVTYYKGS